MSIAENIKNVRERVNAACLRAGRDPKEVTLIRQQDEAGFHADGSL